MNATAATLPTVPCVGPDAALWDHTIPRAETATARARRLRAAVDRCAECDIRDACRGMRPVDADGVWGGELFEAGKAEPVDLPPTPDLVTKLRAVTRCGSDTDTPSGQPPRRRKHLADLCRRGLEPLESLAVAGLLEERDRLLRGWIRVGLSHAEIAAHTKTSTYTISRLIGQMNARLRTTSTSTNSDRRAA